MRTKTLFFILFSSNRIFSLSLRSETYLDEEDQDVVQGHEDPLALLLLLEVEAELADAPLRQVGYCV